MIDRHLLETLGELQQPAAEEAIEALRRSVRSTLPSDYVAMLRISNGVLLHDNVRLYSTDEVPERNATFEVSSYLPDWLMIGDDSGGYGVFLDLRRASGPVLLMDQGSLQEEDAILLAPSLQAWIDAGAEIHYG